MGAELRKWQKGVKILAIARHSEICQKVLEISS